MKPSKITITNLRDDEEETELSAVNLTRYDLITGLLVNAAIVSRKFGLSKKEFDYILRMTVAEYNNYGTTEFAEDLAND